MTAPGSGGSLWVSLQWSVGNGAFRTPPLVWRRGKNEAARSLGQIPAQCSPSPAVSPLVVQQMSCQTALVLRPGGDNAAVTDGANRLIPRAGGGRMAAHPTIGTWDCIAWRPTNPTGEIPPRYHSEAAEVLDTPQGDTGMQCQDDQPLCFPPAGDALRRLNKKSRGDTHGHVQAVSQQL